jgi:hypothetical protein
LRGSGQLEILISDLYEYDTPLPARVALSLGQGQDVFWLLVRGKGCKEVSYQEALSFIHAASEVLLAFRLEIRQQTATKEDDEEFMRAARAGLEEIRSMLSGMK